jgi:NAD(P)-dependent dehydrogenase (short-subunit alcohol dehydrogenase family)
MLEGRNAIVTGAGNGLGLAIARRFVELGARVLLVDREQAVLSRVGAGQLSPNSAFALVKDLADSASPAAIFQEAIAKLGSVDTLVNNAAWSFHKPLTQVTTEEFDRLIAINQRAPYFLVQEFARHVLSATKRPADLAVLNIASVNALSGNENLVAYAGTKGAIVSMTRAMAVELKDLGIRINCISPAAIRTWVTQNLIDNGQIVPEQLFEDYLIKRFASCEEIAELAAYLCGKNATFVNGANWVIDGGYMAH